MIESKDRQCGAESVALRGRSRADSLCLTTSARLADAGRRAAIQTISLHTGYGGRPDPFAESRRPLRCLSVLFGYHRGI